MNDRERSLRAGDNERSVEETDIREGYQPSVRRSDQSGQKSSGLKPKTGYQPSDVKDRVRRNDPTPPKEE